MKDVVSRARSGCRVLFASLVLAPAFGAQAAGPDRYEFRCHAPEGRIVIDLATGLIKKSFPDDRSGGQADGTTITTVFIGSDELVKRRFSFREGWDPLHGKEQVHLFTFPTNLRVETYRDHDHEFRVRPFHRGAAGRWVTEIEVTPPIRDAHPYVLYVEDRRGLAAIRFKSLVALANRTRQVERRFDDLMCNAVSGQPMMGADVRLLGGNPKVVVRTAPTAAP